MKGLPEDGKVVSRKINRQWIMSILMLAYLMIPTPIRFLPAEPAPDTPATARVPAAAAARIKA